VGVGGEGRQRTVLARSAAMERGERLLDQTQHPGALDRMLAATGAELGE
jgi:hypothetical protein